MSRDLDWKMLFAPNESIYSAMFSAGVMGVKLEDCLARLEQIGCPPPREKDIQQWKNGHWHWQIKNQQCILNPILKPPRNHIQVSSARLTDFDTWPDGWSGTDRRWFPCKEDGMPAQKWGYADDYTPDLYAKAEALALAPTGLVGQNMYAQPFIVIDIDGQGHGHHDQETINFGNLFQGMTEIWTSPDKPGSFHIYLSTPYQIPIAHFGWAKIDLMGNQKNAAVYMKNKVSNGIQRAMLTEDMWKALQDYSNMRKARRDEEIIRGDIDARNNVC